MEVVGQVAGVGQLVGYIVKIKRAAEKAKQNKQDCDDLVNYLSVVEDVLPTLQDDPEVARPSGEAGLHAEGGARPGRRLPEAGFLDEALEGQRPCR